MGARRAARSPARPPRPATRHRPRRLPGPGRNSRHRRGRTSRSAWVTAYRRGHRRPLPRGPPPRPAPAARDSPQRRSPWCPGRSLRRGPALLEVSLHFGRRPGLGRALVLAELAPGPALPEQVPALIESLLGGLQRRLLLAAGQLARGEPGSQRVLGLDQLIDAAENLLVVHSFTLATLTAPGRARDRPP